MSNTHPSDKAAEEKYNANFLWGFDDNSIESLGYEFANAKTEAYQKECWNNLIEKIQSSQSIRPDVCRAALEKILECYGNHDEVRTIATEALSGKQKDDKQTKNTEP